MSGYDPQNIFAKILRGEIPCHKVYEDAQAIAFMDIMPRCDGHVLVIPKTPSRNLLDATPETLAALMPAVQKLARACKTAMAAEGVSIEQYNEPASGQTVFHLHFHILPRWEGVKLKPHGAEMAKPEVLAALAEKIKAALTSMA